VLHLIIIVILELPFLIVVASGLAVDAIGYSVLSDACITTCGLAIGGRWAAASLASLPSSPPGSPPGSPTEPGDSNNANVTDVAGGAPAGATMPSKPRPLQRKQQRSGPEQRVAALQRAARATAQALHLGGAPLKPDEVTAVLQEVRRRMGGDSLEGVGAAAVIDSLIASVAAGFVDDGTERIAASSSTLDAPHAPPLPIDGMSAARSGVSRGLACPTADRPTTSTWPVASSVSVSGAPARGKSRPPPLEGDGWGRPARGGVFGMSVDENFARTLNSVPSTPRASVV
jgi:hypothetical protein